MPQRGDLKKILILGSGPIVIGQACEFDYSGTQACKALRNAGYEIVLINSNPASIMTDPDIASKTYIEPLTPEIVSQIILREKPDAILPTMGGQTALNLAVKLSESDFIYAIPVDHSDTVVMRYIQGDSDSLQERARLSLIAQMISAPFFNTLRTEKQLGYVVSAFFYPINRVPGIGMLVQSPVASVSQLRDEFTDFTEQFASDVEQLSIEAFTRHQNAVLTNLQEAPKSLSEMSGRFTESLNLGYTDFQFRALLAEQIRALTVSDIQQAYKRIVLESPRQLWVQTQDSDNGAYIKPDLVNDNYSF